MWIVFLLIGVLAGYALSARVFTKNKVGSLIIDTVDPMNDQPFLLELNKSVNDVYGKKYIVLDVESR